MAHIRHRPSPPIAVTVVLGVILAAYLLTLPGPLRLDTDAGIYLQIAGSLADGTGLHPPGSQSMPPGYPALVAALDVLGIEGPATFSLLALAFLLLALVAAAIVCTLDLGLTPTEVGVTLVATAVSVYVVKYVSVPASELPFFGVGSAALAALTLARNRASPAWLATGVALVGVACTIRTAGVALAAAVALAPAQRAVRRVMVPTVALFGAAVVVIAPYALSTERWTSDLFGTSRDEGWRFLVTSGSVAANVPLSGWAGGLRELAIGSFGGVVLAVVAAVMISRRHELRPTDGYIAATLVMILLFPYEHPRFYLPILPLLIGYLVLAARRVPRLGWAAVAVYCAVGAGALAYSVALSYSGDAFPERYADGRLAATYRVGWGTPRAGDAAEVRPRELAALRRYDPDPPPRWSGGR